MQTTKINLNGKIHFKQRSQIKLTYYCALLLRKAEATWDKLTVIFGELKLEEVSKDKRTKSNKPKTLKGNILIFPKILLKTNQKSFQMFRKLLCGHREREINWLKVALLLNHGRV